MRREGGIERGRPRVVSTVKRNEEELGGAQGVWAVVERGEERA